MSQPHGTEVHASIERMLWRDQVRLLPGSLLAAARRLLRREPRWYLIVDGRVVARMTSSHGYTDLMGWISDSHVRSYRRGVLHGAQSRDHGADAEEPGTS